MNDLTFLTSTLLNSMFFIVVCTALNMVLKPRDGKWYFRLPLILYYVVQISFYALFYKSGATAFSPSIIDFISWALRMLLVYTCYDGSRMRNLAIYSVFSFSYTAARLLLVPFLMLWGHSGNMFSISSRYELSYFCGMATAFIVFVVLIIIILHLLMKKYLKDLRTMQIATIIFTSVNLSGFVLVPIIEDLRPTIMPENVIILITSLLTSLGIVILTIAKSNYDRIVLNRTLEKNACLTEQLTQQYEHLLELEKANAALHKLRHDVANHLLILKDMLTSDTGDPIEYIQRLTDRYHSSSTSEICGNFIFNAVLCREKKVCDENGIDFQYHISVPDKLEICNIDLSGVLTNMLSNAINAARAVPENRRRYVYISAKLSANVLAIAIENSRLTDAEQPECDKRDMRQHGWGINIIKETVEKYDGVFKLKTINDKAFSSATMVNTKTHKSSC